MGTACTCVVYQQGVPGGASHGNVGVHTLGLLKACVPTGPFFRRYAHLPADTSLGRRSYRTLHLLVLLQSCCLPLLTLPTRSLQLELRVLALTLARQPRPKKTPATAASSLVLPVPTVTSSILSKTIPEQNHP